ncbi:hypothetical protein FERRO_08550 [Ferrovum sp. JA12]|nr:hypothetical protein [Ferrovum sp. JA12]KRH79779.1 hypothetical protein FERRO_08550 [Ferrovum sp. JA12]HQT80687.1 hypothetical protein [Ferrovaceae bacterium]HQU05897.1 hypothetical protein [Ferrovaceae bacterium]
MWDSMITMVIVAIAAVYLIRQWTNKSACHGSSACNNCQSSKAEEEHNHC